MLIHLSPQLRSFVEREVASGRFESEDQVIQAALEHFAAEPPFETMTIAEATAEARAQVARGDVVDFAEDFLERSAERAIANSRSRRQVRDDVRY